MAGYMNSHGVIDPLGRLSGDERYFPEIYNHEKDHIAYLKDFTGDR